jgi:hypothetical protein
MNYLLLELLPGLPPEEAFRLASIRDNLSGPAYFISSKWLSRQFRRCSASNFRRGKPKMGVPQWKQDEL